jgi:hypothetical protein
MFIDAVSLGYVADAKLDCARSASSAKGLDEVSKLKGSDEAFMES